MTTAYDVIIVGGRTAGTSLAIHLGKAGVKVLIVERDSFPSRPAVSCPLFFSSGLALLDELGLSESTYAKDHPQFPGTVLEMGNYFRTQIRMPKIKGRDYMYGLDRNIFDNAIWEYLDEIPNVEKRANVAITDLVRDENGQIIGVQTKDETIHAKAVIGADGRHSTVAQKVKATITEEHTEVNTTIYYAYWENCAPYEIGGETWLQIHTGMDGFSFILIPTANNLTGVVAQCRQDYYDAPDGYETWYINTLKKYPAVWERLKNAERVTPISGMKNVRNLYREAGGAGWALVGDAYHQKDSFDGQGMYDALLESKLLAKFLLKWHSGEISWDEAVQEYSTTAYDATHPMFMATLDRLKREVYSEPPPFVAKTILRWVLTDRAYLERFAGLVTRQVHPEKWAPPPVMIKAILGGLAKDLTGRSQKI